MLVTGPFTLTLAQLLEETSPYSGTPSAVAVQVQNVSGFSLLVTAAGEVYAVPPYTCATVPIEPTQQISINPTVELFAVGNLTLVWLLHGEKPPVPDGPIWSGSVGVPQQLLLAPGDPFGAVIPVAASYRTLVLVVKATITDVPYDLVVQGNQSGIPYISTGAQAVAGIQRFVAHLDTAIDSEVVVSTVNTPPNVEPAHVWLVAELDAYDVVVDFAQVTNPAALPVSESGPWNVGSTKTGPTVGQTTGSTTPVQLSAVSHPSESGVAVRALSTNVEPIFVGPAGVTVADGWELLRGEGKGFTCADANLLYIVSTNTVDGVCWSVD